MSGVFVPIICNIVSISPAVVGWVTLILSLGASSIGVLGSLKCTANNWANSFTASEMLVTIFIASRLPIPTSGGGRGGWFSASLNFFASSQCFVIRQLDSDKSRPVRNWLLTIVMIKNDISCDNLLKILAELVTCLLFEEQDPKTFIFPVWVHKSFCYFPMKPDYLNLELQT